MPQKKIEKAQSLVERVLNLAGPYQNEYLSCSESLVSRGRHGLGVTVGAAAGSHQ